VDEEQRSDHAGGGKKQPSVQTTRTPTAASRPDTGPRATAVASAQATLPPTGRTVRGASASARQSDSEKAVNDRRGASCCRRPPAPACILRRSGERVKEPADAILRIVCRIPRFRAGLGRAGSSAICSRIGASLARACSFVERADASGCAPLKLTCDTPKVGPRQADARSHLALPGYATAVLVRPCLSTPGRRRPPSPRYAGPSRTTAPMRATVETQSWKPVRRGFSGPCFRPSSRR